VTQQQLPAGASWLLLHLYCVLVDKEIKGKATSWEWLALMICQSRPCLTQHWSLHMAASPSTLKPPSQTYLRQLLAPCFRPQPLPSACCVAPSC
jgi:hypothetical protein